MGPASSPETRVPSHSGDSRRFPSETWEELGDIYTVKMRSFPGPQRTAKVQFGKIRSLDIETVHCGPVFPVTALKPPWHGEGGEEKESKRTFNTHMTVKQEVSPKTLS